MNSQKHFMRLPLYLIIVYLVASIPITIYIAKNTTQTKEYAHTNPSPTSRYVSPTFNCLANACPTIIYNPETYNKITPSTPNSSSIAATIPITPNPTSTQTSPSPTTDPCKSSTNSFSTQNYTAATTNHREHSREDNRNEFLNLFMDILNYLINIILQILGLPPINTSPAPNPIPDPSTVPCVTNAPIPSLNPSSPLQPSNLPTAQQPSTATLPSNTQQPSTTTTPPNVPAGWTLIWSDEFNGTSGSAVDTSKWTAEVGGHGWGNGEYEYYTNRTENASMDGSGNLVITAIKENLPGSTCWYGACQYTSARLITKGKFDTQYGRIETRAKAPYGQGIWPAFWTLGSNIDQVSWPASGEIDIMEMIGREPSINHGTIHNPNGGMGAPYTLPSGQKFADDFHTFAIEWSENNIKFFVDNNLYETRTNTNSPGTWAFNHPMFLLLNVAVGGQWPGSPDGTTVFPQKMLVDYVRVYKQQ